MSRLSVVLVLVVLACVCCSGRALDNGQALRPQMGWNSWNHFGCGIDEKLIRATAKTIVDTGLAKAGFQYVNLDDCWAVTRDSESRVIADPKGFPSGMFALGSYIHSLGLKFGVYSDAGNEVSGHTARDDGQTQSRAELSRAELRCALPAVLRPAPGGPARGATRCWTP